jgi:hypothetical protein
MNINQIKLQKIINECDKHILRMNRAYKKSSSLFPLEEKVILTSLTKHN